MPNCAAHDCTNRSTIHPEKGFTPKYIKKKMRDSCMAKINQKYLPKKLFICSGYFEPECFKRDLNVKLDFSTSSILMRKATKTDRT